MLDSTYGNLVQKAAAMSLVSTSVQAVWQSAELLIAFHKNKNKTKRDTPFFWRPKEAFARLLAKPEDQEAVIIMRAADDDGADVQIKMHSDKIVIRRDRDLGWSGIIVDDHSDSDKGRRHRDPRRSGWRCGCVSNVVETL